MAEILIVDDEERIGKLLCQELGDAGHAAVHLTDPRRAAESIGRSAPDILITDLRMDGMDGIALLRRTRTVSPATDVIVMTAYASVETALETMKEGAYDYIVKPFGTTELLLLVDRIVQKRRLQSENVQLRAVIHAGRARDALIGESAAMTKIRQIIQGLAQSNASVLVRGESGTGKELVARAIHDSSSRSDGPFVALNCAAIPESLLESELFGYEKGAFTGAAGRKLGHFQLADGGTLFLDEIGDLPLSLQAKLLRVLENHRITLLGGVREVEVNIRLISATHTALEEKIRDRAFREDLFYRLNVFPIVIPPLRDRRDDIPAIAKHFLRGWGRSERDIDVEAVNRLRAYDWPGNVRELRNVLERATILRPTGAVGVADIILGEVTRIPGAQIQGATDSSLNLADTEKRMIERALEVTAGNRSEAARLLGITRRTLYGRMARYGIE